jgi:O-antigen/teichoic acid export membrane protein
MELSTGDGDSRLNDPLLHEVASEVVPSDKTSGQPADLSSLARGGVLNLVGSVFHGAFSFALVIIVTRGLGAGGSGAFFAAIALFMILSNTAELGADTGLLRTIPRFLVLARHRDIRRSLLVSFWPILLVSVALALATFLLVSQFATTLAGVRYADEFESYVQVLAPFLPISVLFTVALAATRGFGTMAPTNLLDRILKPVLQSLLILAVIWAGMGSVALAIAWGGAWVVGAVVAAYYLRRLVVHAERTSPVPAVVTQSTRALAGEFWRFSLPRALAGVMQIGIDKLDVLLVAALASAGAAGVYTASTRYLIAGSFATTAIMQAMQPKISELLALKDHSGSQAVFQASSCWLMTFTWPIYLSLAIMAPVALGVFGPEFLAGQTALVLLSLTMLVPTGVGPVDSVLLMGGKSSWQMVNAVVALVLNVLLNLVLVPKLGINGAAIAWAGSLLVMNLVPLVQVWTHLRLHPFGPGSKKIAIAALGCFGVTGLLVRQAVGPTLTGFLVFVTIGSSLYALVLWRLRAVLQLPVLCQALRRRRS